MSICCCCCCCVRVQMPRARARLILFLQIGVQNVAVLWYGPLQVMSALICSSIHPCSHGAGKGLVQLGGWSVGQRARPSNICRQMPGRLGTSTAPAPAHASPPAPGHASAPGPGQISAPAPPPLTTPPPLPLPLPLPLHTRHLCKGAGQTLVISSTASRRSKVEQRC